jgi:hypothetical protein
MIRPLRQRHRRVFAIIGVLLPLAFGGGIVARRTVLETSILPPELSTTPAQTFTAIGYERDDVFENAPVKLRLWRDLSTGQFAVGFGVPKDFVKPDLIAYWITGQPTNRTELPTNAILLGSFVAATLPLPAEAATAKGSLILFSLADQEIVDISKPLRFGESKR